MPSEKEKIEISEKRLTYPGKDTIIRRKDGLRRRKDAFIGEKMLLSEGKIDIS